MGELLTVVPVKGVVCSSSSYMMFGYPWERSGSCFSGTTGCLVRSKIRIASKTNKKKIHGGFPHVLLPEVDAEATSLFLHLLAEKKEPLGQVTMVCRVEHHMLFIIEVMVN